ncbi:MAG TPA: NAD(P)-binding domain-containing protein, partial [Candidatus Eisenbacteria bacterium]|nr:NAD(P)-binding domain-containing protein [Candidatus Eisenbacteria bacterium]
MNREGAAAGGPEIRTRRAAPRVKATTMYRTNTIIVGGGQAGLAMSRSLLDRGIGHLVLERGRVAERWRSERWDSLMFQFPNWSLRLPGQEYRGDRPDGFATRDEVIAFIERYRERVGAPVRTGVRVDRVRPTDGGFRLEITDGDVDAVNVVVATGPYQEPILPAVRHAIPPAVLQLHASGYRNPAQLPAGAVLVVGSGASGCQIVEDLLAAGRKVFFSVGRHRRYPRRYRGRDMFWWMERIGALDQTLDERPEARDRPNPLVTGVGGGHEIDLRDYAAAGVTLLGHLRDVTGSRLHLADDLEPLLAAGDESVGMFTRAVDAYIARIGLAVPPEPPRPIPPARGAPAAPIRELDLAASGSMSVVWATGFRRDFRWIEAPVFDERGEPIHRRGVTGCAGLYFLGLPWLHKLKSSVLCGVGDDAAHVAEHITYDVIGARLPRAPRA